MTTALPLVRVSTGSQDESTQVTALEDYASAHDIVLSEPMVLHGYSASKGEQEPAIREAIAGIIAGRWSVILVTDSSRLDRREDLDAQAEVLLSIRQAGGDVISTTEPNYGKTDFAGRMATLVAQYGSSEKSRTVKEQTWRGVKAIIANKAWYGPLPPMWTTTGDRYHKQAVCSDPNDVRTIYTRYRDGQSLSSIARDYRSYPQTIRTLLRTSANYTGIFTCHYTHKGETNTWQHTVTPVIDKETWHAVNRMLDEQQENGIKNLGGRPVSLSTNWVSGLLDCPRCGGHLYVRRQKYLTCGGKGKYRKSCGVHGIPLDRVVEQIERLLARDDIKVYRYQRIAGNAGDLAELQQELERVRQTLAITDDDAEFDRLSDRRKELRKEIAEFQLIQETWDMSPTGETLADLWLSGDKRQIMKAVMGYIGIHVSYQPDKPGLTGYVWLEDMVRSADGLIPVSDDTCIKMEVRSNDRRGNPEADRHHSSGDVASASSA